MQFIQRIHSRYSASMPRGQKGEFDAKSRLNGAPAVGPAWCSRTSQNRTRKENPPGRKLVARAGRMSSPLGGPCGYLYVSKDSPFQQQCGRKMRPREGDSRWTGYSEHRRS